MRMTWRRALTLSAAVALVLAAGAGDRARAAGGGGSDEKPRATTPESADYAAAVKAIKADRYADAIPLLERVVAAEPDNADAFNWLGYATRRNGNPAGAVPIYEKALAIDPKHRGAHEYLGEAYLMLGDLPKAREHLKRLDSLCFLPCSEYRDLKKAVEQYEKTGKVSATH